MYSENNINNRYSDIRQYKSFEESKKEIEEIAKNPEAMQNLVNDFQEAISWFNNFIKNKEVCSENR